MPFRWVCHRCGNEFDKFHRFCPNCFNNNINSRLDVYHYFKSMRKKFRLVCPRCKTEYQGEETLFYCPKCRDEGHIVQYNRDYFDSSWNWDKFEKHFQSRIDKKISRESLQTKTKITVILVSIFITFILFFLIGTVIMGDVSNPPNNDICDYCSEPERFNIKDEGIEIHEFCSDHGHVYFIFINPFVNAIGDDYLLMVIFSSFLFRFLVIIGLYFLITNILIKYNRG